MLKKYDIPVSHAFTKEEVQIENELFASMWQLFVQIGIFWKNGKFAKVGVDPAIESSIQSQLLDFMNNRIEQDPAYIGEYRNAREVINELIDEYGLKKAYQTLFTRPVDPNSPPRTAFERARVKVSNEFVLFQLSVGGFKSFGAKNYLGYFGGANIEGQAAPYRTYNDKA